MRTGNAKRFRSPEVLVSQLIDYELAQYDEYMELAHHLMESGSAAEAQPFVALAELCYEKARMLRGIEDIRATQHKGPPQRS
jgi:hypothetical protein